MAAGLSEDDLVELFRSAQDKSSNDNAQLAAQVLTQELADNRQILLSHSANIVVSASHSVEVRRMAAIAVCQCIRPHNLEHQQELQSVWKSLPAVAAKMKDAIFEAIVCEDERMRNQTAQGGCVGSWFGRGSIRRVSR
jgi:hypothetical protein